jgi:hypothetical protein
MLLLPGTDINPLHHYGQAQLAAQILNEAGILIGFIPTESMMDMRYHQLDFATRAQPMKKMAESHRIRATRDGYHNPVARLEHPVGSERMLDLF